MAAPVHFVNARLIDPATGYDGPGALRVAGGAIEEVHRGAAPSPGEGTVIDCGGKPLAPGIVDLRVFVGEPGARHRESFRTAGAAAAAGGVTTFVAQPATDPPLDDPALVQFALNRAREVAPVRVHAMGALTRGLRGAEMTEQQFLLAAGAVALTDADQVMADARLMRACMAYATGLDALVVHHPQEAALSAGACATSGEFASRLGLPAVPAIAERIGLERDLALAEATGCRYHADMLSTAGALGPLARAREAGLRVSAGVSIHHLTLNEFDIADYRTFFKLDPPLRAETDREATVAALAGGLIDVIVSSHLPWDEEAKRLPFEEAATGAVGLETFLPACLRLVHAGQLSLVRLFEAASLAPSRLLGLPTGRLAAGAPADLVLFDPDAPWRLDRFALRSKSKNTPFDRQRLEGRVLGCWVGGARLHEG
ncbi:MAG TPA: dihydroorotase [Thermohalobaculum sp.]|nr:dihydroorotase [Thermohalobaculum sp.]